MTTGANAAIVLAGLFAVLDWIAVARRSKPLEYVAKPATMLALAWTAAALVPNNEGRRWAFVAALLLSMLGDIFLMLPTDRFIAGVGAFAAAHVAYIVGLRIGAASALNLFIGAVSVAVYAFVIGLRIIRAVRTKEPKLAGAVSFYTAIISVMVASAIAAANPFAVVGAVIFMASDTLIAWNRFVQPLAWAPVTIMVTYHVGQALLVLSLTVVRV